MESKFFLFEDEIHWVELGGGVSRKILGYNTQMMMVKVKFNKGAMGALHQHFHSQATYVASGVFEFSIGEETKIIKQGDAVFIKPNIPHSTVCLEEGILMDSFSPVRADFLDGSAVSYFGDKK